MGLIPQANRMSKGSKQRPTDKKKFDEGWDKAFGKKKAKGKTK